MATLQANRHAAKLAQAARKQQKLEQVATERAAQMALAWRVSAIFNYQVAFTRGIHRTVEAAMLSEMAILTDREVYEVLLPLTSLPPIDRYRPEDLSVLISINALQLIVPLQVFESNSSSLQYALDRYSALRMEFRRDVMGLPAAEAAFTYIESHPQVQELKQLAEQIRKDVSDNYTMAEDLHPKLNAVFRNAFGDIGFPKMRLGAFDLDNPPD